ncbi:MULTISPECIES: helix-turn-helix transcriptional regulator [unclassified Streptomyces]|uniref:helix-turn-helix transcriptional regulator n=1 Tax=unclassified Streptomyces TaxID=2593676 RepID=UPI00341EFE61
MARHLDLSPYTVNDHLKALFRKTGADGRDELIAALTHCQRRGHSVEQVTETPGHPSASRGFRRRIGRDRGLVVAQGEDSIV